MSPAGGEFVPDAFDALSFVLAEDLASLLPVVEHGAGEVARRCTTRKVVEEAEAGHASSLNRTACLLSSGRHGNGLR